MEGASVGEKCVLSGSVVGKKAILGNRISLQNCEVQDGNMVTDGAEWKNEKLLVGGLEDEGEFEEGDGWGEEERGR